MEGGEGGEGGAAGPGAERGSWSVPWQEARTQAGHVESDGQQRTPLPSRPGRPAATGGKATPRGEQAATRLRLAIHAHDRHPLVPRVVGGVPFARKARKRGRLRAEAGGASGSAVACRVPPAMRWAPCLRQSCVPQAIATLSPSRSARRLDPASTDVSSPGPPQHSGPHQRAPPSNSATRRRRHSR